MKGQTTRKASRGRTPSGQPNPIDIHVGNRIRLRRTLLGLSQEKLAAMLGLTFQQVQKYERGMNRVGASRLWDLSKVLEVPVDFFYEDMDSKVARQSPRTFSLPENQVKFLEEEETAFDDDPMKRQETIANYPEISYFPEMDYELRKFFGVMKQLAEVDFPEIEKILRYKHGRALDSQLDKIQSELAVFVPRSVAAVPGALVRYKIFLTGSASDSETEKEKNQILQKGAALLKGIYQFLHQEMRKNQTLELSERKIIINKENYIEQILNDFRIRDISAATVF